MDACNNPDILRVIWFFMMLIDIIKIIIPIALIVLGMIEFSKAAISSDENAQKKSGQLFVKRLIYAVLIFVLPWLIEVFIVTLGNLKVLKKEETNFTDCLENANKEKIEQLEQGIIITEVKPSCWQCNNDSSLYHWGKGPGTEYCPASWHKINLPKAECGTKKCYLCLNSGKRQWSIDYPPSSSCPAGWVTTSDKEENCK